MAPTNLIRHSFELAAGRCGDITPMVYRRLFRQHPEAEAMFHSEGADLVKGSMQRLPSKRCWILPAIAAGTFV
jgi:hemoglobin-like flavoprotein